MTTAEIWKERLTDRPDIARTLCPRLTRYIPHAPTSKQRAFLLLPHKEAFYGGAAGGGKLLYNGSMIPTPNGFRELSELHPGDLVFSRDGQIRTILAESEVILATAYRLTFDDGAELIAHDDHRWLTFDAKELAGMTRLDDAWREKRRERRESRVTGSRSAAFTATMVARNKSNPPSTKLASIGTVRTTSEIVATLRTHTGRSNHAIPVAEPLCLPNKTLPLDPYVFGVWLGDGTSCDGAVTTADFEITDAIVKAGFRIRRTDHKAQNAAVTIAYDGLRAVLKQMGVIRNKHIPVDYLWSSQPQRLALLQGLLDTDGGIGNGQAEFTSTKKVLADGVAHLARSLGHKAAVREGIAKLNGRVIGQKWTVKFAAKMQVFRLPRKADRLVLATRRTTRFRYVVAADRVSPIEMKCIRVSSPDHLFLAGEHFIPTHNSDALLMAALQYADVPGYSALILRKTLVDAKKPGSALFRARQWLAGTDAVFSSAENRFYFPTGATLSFGRLSNVGDAYDYQSAEYQFVGADELTQFYENDFEYVCTRLRKPMCGDHPREPDPNCQSCREYAPLNVVPLRIRTASNPGGLGHGWVKKRYQIERMEGKLTPGGKQLFCGQNKLKPHIPAFIEDNPHLDQQSYLDHLASIEDPVTREQLLSGDWGVTEEGRFKPSWIRRYGEKGSWFELLGSGRVLNLTELQTFLIVDPAASKDSTPGKNQLTKKLASHTAVGVFSFTRDYDLLIRKFYRHQKEVPETKHLIRQALNEFPNCQFVGMELSTMSTHLFQLLQGEGFNMKAFSPHTGDKIARSVDVANRMEHGKVYFPDTPSKWLTALEEEIFTWTGHQIETDDQVDILSYAGMHISHLAPKHGATGPISRKL